VLRVYSPDPALGEPPLAHAPQKTVTVAARKWLSGLWRLCISVTQQRPAGLAAARFTTSLSFLQSTVLALAVLERGKTYCKGA